MAAQTKRFRKLRSFGAPAGLQATGFRRALRELVREFIPEDELNTEECVEFEFGEWFGDAGIVPAAYCIERNGPGVWDTTIHVYEIEISASLLEDKVCVYGRMADGDGPLVCLHVFDRYGRERIIDNDGLARGEFWLFARDRRPDSRKECDEVIRDVLKGSAPSDAPPKSERTSKWKAAYDALREMGVEI